MRVWVTNRLYECRIYFLHWYYVYKHGWRYHTDPKWRRTKRTRDKRIRLLGKTGANQYTRIKFRFKKWKLKGKSYGVCNSCGFCRPRHLITVDHIIPVSQGGSLTKDNLQLLCRECHDAKNREESAKYHQPVLN